MDGVVDSVSRSALDERMLRLARRSPVEIGEALGLEPAFVAARVAELLDSRDWLSERQEERLLLVEASSLKDRAFEALDGVDGGEFAQVANVVLRSLKLVAERLDARRKLVESDLDRISSAHARLFAEAFDVALNHIVGVLGDGVDPLIVDAAVSDGLRMSGELLSKRVVS